MRTARAALLPLLLLALPAVADAATVSYSATGTLYDPRSGCAKYGACDQRDIVATFTAADGEANRLSVAPAGAEIVFRDAAAPVTAGAGCRGLPDGGVACPLPHTVRIVLGDGADELVAATGVSADGGAGDDVLAVLQGYGTLDGGAGDDRLSQSGGVHNLRGGEGRDALTTVAGNSTLTGGPGEDVVTGGPDGDTLHDGAGADGDVYDGGGGEDTISYEEETAPVDVDLARAGGHGVAGEGDALANVEHAIGGTGADVLAGTDGPNRLNASTGTGDVLDGRGGDDELRGGGTGEGGEGDDDLEGVADARGGPGNDRIREAGRADGGAGNDVLEGGTLACGEGRDAADPMAGVAADCERVDLPAEGYSGASLRFLPGAARRGVPLLEIRDRCDEVRECRSRVAVRAGGALVAQGRARKRCCGPLPLVARRTGAAPLTTATLRHTYRDIRLSGGGRRTMTTRLRLTF